MVAPLILTKNVDPGVNLPSFAPGFTIYGVIVDNDTGNWLLIQPGNFVVPPWTYGWSQPVNGSQSLSFLVQPGPTIVPSVNLGTAVNITFTEAHVPQSNGFTAVTSVSTVSGTVTIGSIIGPVTIGGTVAVSSVAGTVTITGSVVASGTVDIGTVAGTVTVGGSVAVSSVGGTVTISGNVVASGTVAVSTIGGTVTVGGTVGVSTVGGTVNIAGSVTVSNTITVTGSVNIGNTPSVTISGTPSVTIASGSVSISGSITVGTITAGNVQITPGIFTAGGQGVTVVAVTGTAVVLHTTIAIKVLMIKARSANAGTVYLGTSTVTNNETAGTGGLQLDPGDMVTFTDTDISHIYINGTAGDGVSYIYWT